MRFDKFIPTEKLRHYIRHFVVSESDAETEYKVFPSAGLVIGFQYRGQLSTIRNQAEDKLASSGITGISGNYKIFKNSAKIGTILVCFTETGFSHFSSHPAHDLFNLSIPLSEIFTKSKVSELEEKLAQSNTDKQRIDLVEHFLIAQLNNIRQDKLIMEAVKLIYQSNGNIRIKELADRLFISQSAFEKRFRKIAGATPKKFSSIIRFNAVLSNLTNPMSLTEICYENNFFDQAHFIKDFKQFTGSTPESFKRLL